MKIDVAVLKAGLDAYFATPSLKGAIDELKAKFRIGAIITLVVEAVAVVEKLAADMDAVGSGSEKKQAVKEWIDDVIKLPIYLEPFDGAVIGMAIDALVTWYNLKHGKQWVTKILGVL